MPGIRVPIVGDAKSVLTAFEQTKIGAKSVGAEVNKVNLSVARSAELQGRAAVKTIGRLQAEVVEYRRLGAGAAANSKEQAAYTALAARSQARLNRATGVSVATTGGFSKATRAAEHEVNKMSRGVLAGSGLLSRFSRSLAFSSSGFITFAAGAAGVASSIKDAEGLEKAQASLGVAIKHTGGDLAALQPRYEATAKAAARFGISEIEATTGLARATVLTGDAAAAQRAYQEALVISKATGKDFNIVLTAAAKGQEGITTSLRRYGILVNSTTSGQDQFTQVMRRFGGQAAANTTKMEQLDAAFTNALTTIGIGLLPAFNSLAGRFADWLTKMNNSGQLQKDVNAGLTVTKDLLGPVAQGFKLLADSVGLASDAWRKFNHQADQHHLGGALSLLTKSFPSIIDDEINRVKQLNSYVLGEPTGANPPPIRGDFKRYGGRFAFTPPGLGSPAGMHPAGPFGGAKPLTQFWQKFSLNYREQLAQAQAALTRSNTDDVAEARREVARIKRLIDEGRLHGQGLLQALSLEASAVSTIQGAEQAAAQERLNRLQAEKSQLDQRLQTLKQQDARLAARIRAIQDRYRQTVQSITQGIGQLFQGPVLAPTEAQRKTALGLPAPTAHRLTEDLNAQVAQYRRLNRDLAKLRREGASKALIAELRGQGVSAIPEIEALTGGGKGQRDSFFKAFAARERLAQNTAKQMLSVQLHTLAIDRAQLRADRTREHKVSADGRLIAGELRKIGRELKHSGVRTTGSGQTSGRNPGR